MRVDLTSQALREKGLKGKFQEEARRSVFLTARNIFELRCTGARDGIICDVSKVKVLLRNTPAKG